MDFIWVGTYFSALNEAWILRLKDSWVEFVYNKTENPFREYQYSTQVNKSKTQVNENKTQENHKLLRKKISNQVIGVREVFLQKFNDFREICVHGNKTVYYRVVETKADLFTTSNRYFQFSDWVLRRLWPRCIHAAFLSPIKDFLS